MKYPAVRLAVYETLYALNRDFEQVLVHLARLQELGMFQPEDFGDLFPVIIQETRAWANMELVEALRPREQDDWTHFGRLHRRWEKKLQDPNDVLIEAKLLMEKRRKAAGKKGRRKQREAGSEGV